MANPKSVKTRIQNKHDFEVNWLNATNFIPLPGELIIYDKEVDDEGNLLVLENGKSILPEGPEGRTTPYTYARQKIGDGVTNVIDLPFVANQADWNQLDEKQPDYIKNKPTKLSQFENDKDFIDKTGGTFDSDASLAISEEYRINTETYEYDENGVPIPIPKEHKVGESGVVIDKDSILLNYTYNDLGMGASAKDEAEEAEESYLSLTKDSIHMHKEEFEHTYEKPTYDLKINLDSIKVHETLPAGDGSMYADTSVNRQTNISPGSVVVSKTPEGYYASSLGDNTVTIDPLNGITFVEHHDVEYEGGGVGAETYTTTITSASFNNKAEKSVVESLSDRVTALSSVGLTREIVEELPAIEEAKENVIYMIGGGVDLQYKGVVDCGDEDYNGDDSGRYVRTEAFFDQNRLAEIFKNVKTSGSYKFTQNGDLFTAEVLTGETIDTSGTNFAYYGITRFEDYYVESAGSEFEMDWYWDHECTSINHTVTLTVTAKYTSYDEYMYIAKNRRYESIGSTKVDLSRYATKNDLANYLPKTGQTLDGYKHISLSSESNYESSENPTSLSLTYSNLGEDSSHTTTIKPSYAYFGDSYGVPDIPSDSTTINGGQISLDETGTGMDTKNLTLRPDGITLHYEPNFSEEGPETAVITAATFKVNGYGFNKISTDSIKIDDIVGGHAYLAAQSDDEGAHLSLGDDLGNTLKITPTSVEGNDTAKTSWRNWLETDETFNYLPPCIKVTQGHPQSLKITDPIALKKAVKNKEDLYTLTVSTDTWSDEYAIFYRDWYLQITDSENKTIYTEEYTGMQEVPEWNFTCGIVATTDFIAVLDMRNGVLGAGTDLAKAAWQEWLEVPEKVDTSDFANKEDLNDYVTNETFKDNTSIFDGSHALGSLSNKTITDFRNSLKTWLDTNSLTVGASANFYAPTTWVALWNNENVTTTVGTGSRWIVSVIGSYTNSSYVQLRISTYSDGAVYYVCCKNNIWQPVRKVASSSDLNTLATTFSNELKNYLPKTDAGGMYVIDTPLNIKTNSKDNYFINKSGDASLNVRSDVASGTASITLGQDSKAKYAMRVRPNTDDPTEPSRFDIYDFVGSKSVAIIKSVEEIKQDAFENGNGDTNSGMYIGSAKWPTDKTPSTYKDLDYQLAKVIHERNIGDYAVLKENQVNIQICTWEDED